jgi:NAD(P)-dependent dehydrogenase (short-subunit alcohol dehydrogenase family)
MLNVFKAWRRRMPQSPFRPVVLVTGCGSGIGLALTDLLYNHPEYRVVCTARSRTQSTLKARYPESDRFWIRTLDVTDEDGRVALIQEIERHWQGVNILINNAGISYRAVVEHMTEADERLQLSTNYLGPVGLIRAVLPHMRQIGRGKIINVSSVSGMLAMPTMASYSASKYALEGMSEALWYELRPLGINVSLIQPGFVRSESFLKVYHSKLSHPDMSRGGPYGDYYENMAPFVERLMNQSWTTPQTVAKRVLQVIQTENPPLWIPVTIDAWFFYYLRRWLPRRVLLPLLFALLPRARHWGSGYSRRRRGD